ncbi:thiolase C-terminal domain-containing protein [Mycolicibacterium sp. CBM1]
MCAVTTRYSHELARFGAAECGQIGVEGRDRGRAVGGSVDSQLAAPGDQRTAMSQQFRAQVAGHDPRPCLGGRALRTQRMLEVDQVPASALEAVALAGYHHAQNNPRAVAYGRPLDHDRYQHSRLISEPLRLFDCSRENDGAAAILVVPAERAGDYRGEPAYILSGVQGASSGWSESVENEDRYTSAGFHPALVARLWQGAAVGPREVDVAQVYENFTGPAVAAMIDHGLCPPGPAAADFMTVENLTVENGDLPINTAGGNIAEGFVHGIGLVAEAVRQIRGGSANPVAGAEVSLLIGGPMAPLVSSTLFGSTATI